jgi:hypothetical protein
VAFHVPPSGVGRSFYSRARVEQKHRLVASQGFRGIAYIDVQSGPCTRRAAAENGMQLPVIVATISAVFTKLLPPPINYRKCELVHS